jgi:hypothetical protein
MSQVVRAPASVATNASSSNSTPRSILRAVISDQIMATAETQMTPANQRIISAAWYPIPTGGTNAFENASKMERGTVSRLEKVYFGDHDEAEASAIRAQTRMYPNDSTWWS